MPAPQRKGLLARRRRHDDEGEEDGSIAGDMADDASTTGSLTTDAEEDALVSNVSVDEDGIRSTETDKLRARAKTSKPVQSFKTTADTAAMLNGIKINTEEHVQELHFDDTTPLSEGHATPDIVEPDRRSASQPKESTGSNIGHSTFSANRKGYFLHDDRHHDSSRTLQANFRGRGRGGGGGVGGPVNKGTPTSQTRDSNQPWTHDLHESVNQPAWTQPTNPTTQLSISASTTPNRSFSTTTVLGNVPVNVSIPGVEKRITASMVKKHYTLLPQHRPPLRRDKPVRISIPNEHPRYIFPSTERSFIFIPRAMRPNQHQGRGRGRGSFHGSRRTSMYSYTPSVGMSRRPSIAASNSGSGMHTPTGPPVYQVGLQKPIVRMPGQSVNLFLPLTHNTEVFMGDNSAIIHSPPATLPMHQPVPQKTVSVADIESPTRAPQQQTQQPFHQQMPSHLPDTQQPQMPHIPEGAVYAQPFQPYPFMPHPNYATQFPQANMWALPADQMAYNRAMGGPVMAPIQHASTTTVEGSQQSGAVAHESNGMVYYYDPSQQFPNPMMNNMNMMQTPYFYPQAQSQMFYH